MLRCKLQRFPLSWRKPNIMETTKISTWGQYQWNLLEENSLDRQQRWKSLKAIYNIIWTFWSHVVTRCLDEEKVSVGSCYDAVVPFPLQMKLDFMSPLVEMAGVNWNWLCVCVITCKTCVCMSVCHSKPGLGARSRNDHFVFSNIFLLLLQKLLYYLWRHYWRLRSPRANLPPAARARRRTVWAGGGFVTGDLRRRVFVD